MMKIRGWVVRVLQRGFTRLWSAGDRTARGSACQRVKPPCAAVWTELIRVPHCCSPSRWQRQTDTVEHWEVAALESVSFFSIHPFMFLSFSQSTSQSLSPSSLCLTPFLCVTETHYGCFDINNVCFGLFHSAIFLDLQLHFSINL